MREAVGARAELIHNKAWAETNSLYSLGLCRDWVSGALLVINCDVLFHAEVLYRLLACPGSAFAYDSSSGTEEEHTKVEIDEDASLTSMSKTLPTYRSQGENVGCSISIKEPCACYFARWGPSCRGAVTRCG